MDKDNALSRVESEAVTQVAEVCPPSSQVAEPEASRIVHKSGSATAALLISLLALLVAGVCAWQIFEQRLRNETVRHDLAERLSAVDVALAKTSSDRERVGNEMAAMQKQFDTVAENATQALSQAKALEDLYQRSSRTETERMLAEVEQAITIGMQQLRLADDADAALFAFQSAESRLAVQGQADLQNIRAALIKEMAQIRALPRVDLAGAALRLEVLFDRIEKLPLAYELKPEGSIEPVVRKNVLPADAGWWQRTLDLGASLAADVWDEITSLVRLERIDSSKLTLLAPTQGDFVRNSLKTRLLTARLALLAGDRATFKADMERCGEALKRFFDPRDQGVIESLQEITELAALPPKAPMPEMEETWTALRQAQARLDSAAEHL